MMKKLLKFTYVIVRSIALILLGYILSEYYK